MTRIDPIFRREWTSEFVEALQSFEPPTVRIPRVERPLKGAAWAPMEMFAHNVDLARAFLTFNGHVLWGTTLTARQRHVIILRVAVRRRSEFLWGEHSDQALDAGLSEDEIARMGQTEPGLADETEAALVCAVDELVDDGAVSAETWTVLARTLAPDQLLDAVFTAGCYQTVAAFMRSLELEADPAMTPLPQEITS